MRYALFLLFFGCSENQLVKVIEEEPNIAVNPVEIDFGTVNVTEPQDTIFQQVELENKGNETLIINSISFEGQPSYFSISQPSDFSLEPLEKINFSVFYNPELFSSDYSQLTIRSNDPDTSKIDIYLKGQGGAPSILVEPDMADFDLTPVGCSDEITVKISNIGNVDLIIGSIDFFVSYPEDMSIDMALIDSSLFPIIITSSSFIEIPISYIPDDISIDSSFLKIESNDPVNPVVFAEQFGEGVYTNWKRDVFEKSSTPISDILFVIDNSGSMAEEQANMATNFNYFINALTALSVDYHIAVITTDSPIFRGPVITNLSSDPISQFSNQVMAGTTGSSLEMGLEMAYLATKAGGSAAPGSSFFRSSAFFSMIFISDEEDFSPRSYSDYLYHFRSLKVASNLVISHAIAGDFPYGCHTASFGGGYYELVNDMSGDFLSICSATWGVGMESLAIQSAGATPFSLSEYPLEDSISVYIDGVELLYGWVYDSLSNSIIFSYGFEPQDGQIVEIKYAIKEEC
jgi:hypothetical protein